MHINTLFFFTKFDEFLLCGYVIFIMHKIAFFVDFPAEIRLFQSLNQQECNLKIRPLTKSVYYIVPNSSKF